MIGRTLLHYEITGRIGAGGMGEVYRATDARLGREVALKVLSREVATDEARLSRFRFEARALATLNHPGIAAIHGLEEAEDQPFLVMELVEGEDLEQRLTGGPLRLEEALRVASQVAGALAAAHEQGILHRDLKPSNIGLTRDGDVKLLDFGLAKAFAVTGVDESGAVTLSTPTREGTVLGTVPYMSPEQARGEELDTRSDVWSFGCVLYEILSGRRAFPGKGASEAVAAVLRSEPDWSLLPATTPALTRQLLRGCLRKDRRLRLRDIHDVRIHLEDSSPGAAAGVASGGRQPRRESLPWAVAALASAGAMVLAFRVIADRPAPVPHPPRVTRLSANIPPQSQLTTALGSRVVTFSPDGSSIAYVADERVYLRPVGQLLAVPVIGTEGGAGPFFSPDGRWIGFHADGQLKKAPVDGGPAISLCDADEPSGVTWSRESGIVFAQGREGIWRVSPEGGRKELLIGVAPGSGDSTHEPDVLPGSAGVVYTLGSESGFAEDAVIVVERPGDPESRRVLIEGGTAGRYVPTGHLVFARAGDLLAVRFDLASLSVTSDAVTVVEGVMQAAQTMSQWTGVSFSFSSTGSLVYVPDRTRSQRRLLWVDRNGGRTPLPIEAADFSRPRVSPDGRRLVIALTERDNTDVWIFELHAGGRSRLTFDAAVDNRPTWGPDGQRVAFRSMRDEGRSNVYWKRADGTGQAERLTTGPASQVPQAWVSDTILVNQANPTTGWDVMTLDPEARSEPEPLLEGGFAEIRPAVSPNGRWLAYMSDETGQPEIYVRTLPDPEMGFWQVSSGGGISPVWGPDGRELFYRSDDKMMLVPIGDGPGFESGPASILFTGSYVSGPGRQYDISPDGQRFLMLESAHRRDELVVVGNWFAELEQRLPEGPTP